jgi:hypothetical protein
MNITGIMYSITCPFIHFTSCRIMKGLPVKRCIRNIDQMNFYSISPTFEVCAVQELLATHKTFVFLSTAVHALNMTTQLAACGESLFTFCALVRSFTWKYQLSISDKVCLSNFSAECVTTTESGNIFFACVSL